MHFSVPFQRDFAFGRNQYRRDHQGFKPQEDVIAVMEDEFGDTGVIAVMEDEFGELTPFSSCGLGILVTGHDVSKVSWLEPTRY